jgi:TolB-like protein/DNA-binding winged helix-turn-helix (wHTH) protein
MSAQARGAAWQIGAWTADPSDDTLARGAESQKIEPRMMRLLLCLARSAGTVLSQDHLLSEVWGGVVVGPASVYQSVSQLRKVLGDTGTPPSYIETVARKGYRLIAPVRRPESVSLEPLSAPEPQSRASVPVVMPEQPRWRWLLGAVATVIVAIATAAFVLWPRLASQTDEPSIVVLPIVDMTVGGTEQPFCDGLTEELSNWLAQIPILRVVARTSAFAFRDRNADVREIGRQLGTTHVLEGSLRRSGNVLRVTVQLVATKDGYNVWSGSYDFSLTDVFQVQEQVARAVADNLELRLGKDTAFRLADRRSTSGRAYSLYLVARHHQQQRTKQDNDRAIELYQDAIAADSNFALAQVGLAYAYLNQRFFNNRPIESIARDAQPLLASAAHNAPQLADLYVARGALETELLRKNDALRDLRHAAALNPNSREAAAELGFYYLVSGEPRRALGYYSHAAELDPLDYNLHAQRCLALTDLAEFDSAAAACERARALEPASAWAYRASSAFEEARGRILDALNWNTAALAHSPDLLDSYAERGTWLLTLGLTDRLAANRDAAVAAAGNMRTQFELIWLDLIAAYAAGGPAAVRALIDSSQLSRSDDPTVLFALARAELLADDAQNARALVDRALASPELTSEVLASPWQARIGCSNLLIAAAAYQATGDGPAARARLDQLSALLNGLVAAGVRRHGVYGLQAQVAALRGDPDSAMAALQRAAELGWRDVWLAEHEPQYASLRARPDFSALTRRIRAENDAESQDLAARQDPANPG